MELLVATLARLIPGSEADGIARVRLITERMRNAPGLINARFFQSRGQHTYYFALTTWEDEQMWQQVEERFSPKHLLLGSATELLAQPPEQWRMRYLWGYSRPAVEPTLAAVHFATTSHNQGEIAQRGWIESLRRLVMQPHIAFAFLARGLSEQAVDSMDYGQGPIFLNFLSWSTETEREEFYTDPNYKAINRFLSSIGIVQTLALDAL